MQIYIHVDRFTHVTCSMLLNYCLCSFACEFVSVYLVHSSTISQINLLILRLIIRVAFPYVNVSSIVLRPVGNVKTVPITFQFYFLRLTIHHPLLTRTSITCPQLNAVSEKSVHSYPFSHTHHVTWIGFLLLL